MHAFSLRSCAIVLGWCLVASQASADIFEWAWVNPNNPGQGKVQSSIVCPGGHGVSAAPNANLSALDLTQAYLIGSNINGANFSGTSLSNADLTNANLTSTCFNSATLANATLTGAAVTGAAFESTTSSGFTAQQLYSTASYKAGDLHGMYISFDNLTGWDFHGQNLTSDYLRYSTLTNANVTGAAIVGVDFIGVTGFTAQMLSSTASYGAKDLHGISLPQINLTGCDFSGFNLTKTDFESATVTNANFTGATVAQACFVTTNGFTAQQLYSTASYKAGDLHGIWLQVDDLTGWDFHGQNLTGAGFFRLHADQCELQRGNGRWGGARRRHDEQGLYGPAALQHRQLQGR